MSSWLTPVLVVVLLAGCAEEVRHDLTGTISVHTVDWEVARLASASSETYPDQDDPHHRNKAFDWAAFHDEVGWVEASSWMIGRDCSAGVGGGFDDIAQNTPVEVRDQDGTIIASGSVGAGAVALVGTTFLCQMEFQVTGLPDADFYQIAIGRESRGSVLKSALELQDAGWHLDLVLTG